LTNLSLNDLQLIYYRRLAQPGQTIALADEADISTGVEATLYPFHRWTLYLRAAGLTKPKPFTIAFVEGFCVRPAWPLGRRVERNPRRPTSGKTTRRQGRHQ
jgi:hypothetical protein